MRRENDTRRETYRRDRLSAVDAEIFDEASDVVRRAGSCDLDAAHHMRGLEIARCKGFPPAERITVVEWQQYV